MSATVLPPTRAGTVSSPAPAGSPSVTKLPGLTRGVKILFWVIALLFTGSVALCLNGSSSSSYHYTRGRDIHLPDAPEGLLLSTPKGIRSDEFMVCTPAMLSQARAEPSFPVENASYGAGKVPLIMGLPARHYTMIFRPGLWGFFVLPFEWGFSWYWNVKIFGLFAALFVLFHALTGGRLGASIAGAILVQYAGFTQWWFSSPAMLPEMLTAWAAGTVAALGLCTAVSVRTRLALAAVVAFSVAAFVLCCYPPFAIPLFYLSAVIVTGYALQYHPSPGKGWLWIVFGCLGGAALILPWFLECRETISLVAHTAYPGQRVSLGGGLSLARFLSGIFGFGINEGNTPAPLLNVCEASNFYPVWWLPIGLGTALFARHLLKSSPGGDVPVAKRLQNWFPGRALVVLLGAYVALLTWYALVGFPAWLCSLTLLGRCTEQRCLLPIGVAGTLLAVLCVPASSSASATRSKRVDCAVVLAVWGATVMVFLLLCRSQMPGFLVPWRIALFEGTALGLAGAYLWAPPAWFLVLLPALSLWHNALINPVCRGLPELTQSRALQFVRGLVEAEPTASWASFDNLSASEMIKACGGRVINGLRVVPDLPGMRRLDPAGKAESAYNRYCHIIFEPLEFDEEPRWALQQNIYCIVEVHPSRLARLYPDLGYVVCTRPLRAWREAGLQSVEVDLTANSLWIYRVVREPEMVTPPMSSPEG